MSSASRRSATPNACPRTTRQRSWEERCRKSTSGSATVPIPPRHSLTEWLSNQPRRSSSLISTNIWATPEVGAIVRLAKYPPIGNRGISGQGPHTGYNSYGARHATEYAPGANENIIICPSIESLEGLENVEEIAAVEGIDMIAYGHSDLSAQLGVHLDLEHPTFKAAVRRIAAACNAHGKLARGSAETEAQIEEYWQLGCKVLNLPGNDVSTYLDGMKARAGRAHARLKSIGVPTR